MMQPNFQEAYTSVKLKHIFVKRIKKFQGVAGARQVGIICQAL